MTQAGVYLINATIALSGAAGVQSLGSSQSLTVIASTASAATSTFSCPPEVPGAAVLQCDIMAFDDYGNPTAKAAETDFTMHVTRTGIIADIGRASPWV